MEARILRSAARFALRSVALILFPCVFIALFAWATAGSTSGNTSDPIRASIWLWLGAHQVPFLLHSQSTSGLSAGALSILPLAAVALPYLAIRRSYQKLQREYKSNFKVQLFFAFCYSLIAEVMALLSYTKPVHTSLIYAPISAFLLALVASTKLQSSAIPILKFSMYLMSILLGVATCVYSACLVAHWNVLHNIEVVVSPGLIGGVLYTILQILYLPNIAFATLGYLTASGFTFGVNTGVSYSHLSLKSIPAIPALAGLPTGVHPSLVFGAGLLPILFLLIIVLGYRYSPNFKSFHSEIIVTFLLFILGCTTLSYLSSGELLTSALNPVGVEWIHFSLNLCYSAIGVMILFVYSPRLIGVLRRRMTKNV